jgi:hypothetical protein
MTSSPPLGAAARPGPRRIRFGADAWAVLLAQAKGLRLSAPFGADDGPALDDAQRGAAEAALRSSPVVPGSTGDLLADLHPSVRASLLIQVQPTLVVDTRVGLGGDVRTARHALAGPLASGLQRAVRSHGSQQAELGPVELSTMLAEDLVPEVLGVLGDLSGPAGRTAVEMDAATSVAAVSALQNGRDDLAQAIAPDEQAAPVLRALAHGLQSIAIVEVAGADQVQMLVAMRTGYGWWRLDLSGSDVLLAPVGEQELSTDATLAVAAALGGEAA